MRARPDHVAELSASCPACPGGCTAVTLDGVYGSQAASRVESCVGAHPNPPCLFTSPFCRDFCRPDEAFVPRSFVHTYSRCFIHGGNGKTNEPLR